MLGVLTILVAQTFYTIADVLQKKVLNGAGFSARTLLSPFFLATLLVSGTGFIFQMHALSKLDLSKTVILLSVFGVVLAAIAGVVVFHDRLTWYNQVGIVFAIAAIIMVRAN